MATYRDERDALRARSEGLAQDLAEKTAEVEELRKNAPTEARLEELARELAAAQAEVGKLRAELHPNTASKNARGVAIAVSGVVVLGALGVAGLTLVGRSRPAPPWHEVTPTEVALTPTVPAPVAASPLRTPSPTPEAPAAAPVPDPPARHLSTVWKGRVTRASGVDVAPGTPCEITAAIQHGAKWAMEKLTVVCGTHALYSTEDRAEGWSSTGFDITEEPVKGGFARTLAYRDTGEHTGRTDVEITTRTGKARVWSTTPKTEVELTIDELDAPQAEALVEGSEKRVCARATVKGKAIAVDGDAGVAKGAACEVHLRPATQQCQVLVSCGKKALYANGYAAVADGAIVDDKFSTEDHDPKVRVSGKEAEVSDKGVTSWRVKIALDSALP